MEQPEQAASTTRVAMYLSSRIITGLLHLRARVRLTEILNSWEEEFVTLEDPWLIHLHGDHRDPVREEGPLFVPRQEILLLHEISMPEERAVQTVAPDARVAKVATPIRAYAGPLRVAAELHLSQHSTIDSYLNRAGETFVPLTAVSITFPTHDHLDPVIVSFALANRNRLIIARKGSGVSPEKQPD
jgi:hypothetical protein